uniref:DUF676 domain-containing protein n=1 Tax=Bursaphelenchus xylophilus TaxID=6326 RepID=A0A1I7SHP1_BURXY
VLCSAVFRKNPVVFIHGPTSYAGHLQFITDQFKQVGYTESELYGTTYGEKKDVFETTQPNLYCSYVKLQRDFIKAVAKYTQRPVDVLAFSVGAVIARKAILGGTCAESDENLGEPLTATVRNFISVGGPHHGRAACNNEGCDQLIGLWCHSKFIADLKDKLHYEGSRTISLWSSHDDYIGYKVCDGEPTAQIEQSDVALEIPDLSHQQLIWFITPLLIDLINGKNVTKEDAAKAAFKALLEFNKNPRPWPYSSRNF